MSKTTATPESVFIAHVAQVDIQLLPHSYIECFLNASYMLGTVPPWDALLQEYTGQEEKKTQS